jgi:altronate hydrolase
MSVLTPLQVLTTSHRPSQAPPPAHPTLRIDPADNVIVALRALEAGETVDGVAVKDPIPAGHKVATRAIAVGPPVVKYGYPIGVASVPIEVGQHVHSHNVKSAMEAHLHDLTFVPHPPTRPTVERMTFQGYRRHDGRAATRNEIWIVNLVGCVNHASERIAAQAHKELAGTGIDGVYAFPHPFGCSQLGDDLRHTQKVLAGLCNHPNAAAVLILGLGCENNQMKLFLEQLGAVDAERFRYFNAQDVTDEVDEGVAAVRELADFARQFQRETIDAKELIVAMKCGGSDGFSGISANPTVGRVADRFAAMGATVILSEVPEMFGAEKVLLDRATDKPAFDGTIKLVNEFRDSFTKYHEPIDENPSPGNKAGGITTLAEKSLGCVQKGGRAPVAATLDYGQPAPVGTGALALVNAPGNDGVSCTAMTVAGAHVILFTTGRGTPMGFPAPTIKIASNTDLAKRKPAWIDFNAGVVVDGTRTLDEAGADLSQLVLDVASGKTLTRNERNGFREIAIWKDGVTL